MKKIQVSSIIFIALLIVFIDLQTKFTFIKESFLGGALIPAKTPTLGIKNIFTGEYQRTSEKWLARNTGLRSNFIKLHNQLNFWFFREVSLNLYERVIVGKDNYLYQNSYISSYNRLDIIPEEVIEEKVRKIKALQDFMKKRNRSLLLCITPSKATIYSEYIPDRFIAEKRLNIKSNYDRLVPLLDKYGVIYADGRRLFLKLKKDKWPLFPKSGTHWNYYGAFMYLSAVNEKLKTLSGKKLPDLHLRGVRTSDKPEIFIGLQTADDDIANVMNVFFPSFSYGNYVYPDIPRTEKNSNRPDILIVGGSFNWQLIDIMFRYDLYSKMDFFYYFSRHHTLPTSFIDNSNIIDKNSIKWKKDILSKDIILIEVNEENIFKMGSGFIEDTYKNAML